MWWLPQYSNALEGGHEFDVDSIGYEEFFYYTNRRVTQDSY